MVKKLSGEGYSVKNCCEAVGISRSRYYSFQKHKEKEKSQKVGGDVLILQKIKTIKTEHPFWG
ncbi:hypothetical protein [Thermodesulfovibrio sp. Kuro-1]|uniref:hypothetical protein n=1 Tax=Thermodesulfovibrio sp. Kuro-1 TaxID=2580394 RepID=UPI0035A311F6